MVLFRKSRSWKKNEESAVKEPVVAEWMRTDVAAINPELRVARVWETMWRKQVRHLPVVDEAGQLVGILTETDLLKALVFVLERKSHF